MRSSIIFKNKRLYYLDQTKLPAREVYRECKSLAEGYGAIKSLRVRGAPLIGVFAAYSVYISMRDFNAKDKKSFLKYFDRVVKHLKSSRPTAVNLFWALDRISKAVYFSKDKDVGKLKNIILKQAETIHFEDINLCLKMAKAGLKLIKSKDRILTHCNTGFLATSGQGTALAVIYEANRKYKNIRVYADETRPLLQGARLTAWELHKRGVDVTVVTDGMAAYLMQQKRIDKIFVGADRIAANGDTANKIGTYSIAVIAKYHKLPFYVVAPSTTFDLSAKAGCGILIEQRASDEVRTILGKVRIVPRKVKTYNPAFDITPHKLISAIVTDRGLIYPPFKKNIRKFFPRLLEMI